RAQAARPTQRAEPARCGLRPARGLPLAPRALLLDGRERVEPHPYLLVPTGPPMSPVADEIREPAARPSRLAARERGALAERARLQHGVEVGRDVVRVDRPAVLRWPRGPQRGGLSLDHVFAAIPRR